MWPAHRRGPCFGLQSVSRAKHGAALRSVLEQAQVAEAKGTRGWDLQEDPGDRRAERLEDYSAATMNG